MSQKCTNNEYGRSKESRYKGKTSLENKEAIFTAVINFIRFITHVITIKRMAMGETIIILQLPKAEDLHEKVENTKRKRKSHFLWVSQFEKDRLTFINREK